MRIRRAGQGEAGPAVELARKLGLDYPGMDADELWVAEEAGRVVGLVALKTHPDCRELCALGVDPAHRGKGAAKALVEALVAAAPGDVHLATVSPAFFESCGFEAVTGDVPATFPAKRETDWCEGCRRELCTVMRLKAT
ncbi:MAG TPA: GNAT family N-acetyltransferase [Candidatus Aminicenantes bacterium]|nr:GNAT family N-acetyltransferase [Candidatus Aminicenantes bacterium]